MPNTGEADDEIIVEMHVQGTGGKNASVLHNRELREVFANFSQSSRKFFEVLTGSETCSDLFGPTRMHSDTF